MNKRLSSKSSGEMAELLFAAECYKHNIVVCFPHSDNVPYDFVIDTGKKLLKIQVKSSRHKKGNSSAFTINYNVSKHSNNLDFYALYCYETNNFYIIPVNKIKTNTFYGSKKNQVYKNNWQLLKV